MGKGTDSMWEGRHNYHLNSATVLQDVYRLLSTVMGDRAVMDAAAGSDDRLRTLRNQFIEDELVHLLVATAVANRIQLEHMAGPRNDPDELSYSPLVHECGQLQQDVSVLHRIPLTFREACNKIIHAEAIVAQTTGVPEETPVGTIVALRGRLRQVTWLAHLDVVAYARGAVRNFEDGL